MSKSQVDININNTCKFFGGKNKSGSQCKSAYKDCHKKQCKNEYEELVKASPTENDIAECQKQKDFMKIIECNDKLKAKLGTNAAEAKYNHCEANKCEKLNKYMAKVKNSIRVEFDNKLTKAAKKYNNTSKHNKKGKKLSADAKFYKKFMCIKEKCKSKYKIAKLRTEEDDCKKKHKTYNAQVKCIITKSKQIAKHHNDLYKCTQKHCE